MFIVTEYTARMTESCKSDGTDVRVQLCLTSNQQSERILRQLHLPSIPPLTSVTCGLPRSPFSTNVSTKSCVPLSKLELLIMNLNGTVIFKSYRCVEEAYLVRLASSTNSSTTSLRLTSLSITLLICSAET